MEDQRRKGKEISLEKYTDLANPAPSRSEGMSRFNKVSSVILLTDKTDPHKSETNGTKRSALPLKVNHREQAREETLKKARDDNDGGESGFNKNGRRIDLKKVMPTPAEAQEILSIASERCRAYKLRREKERAAQYKLRDLPANGKQMIEKYFRIVQGLVKVYFSPDISEEKSRRIAARAKTLMTQIQNLNQGHSKRVSDLLRPFVWQLKNVIAVDIKKRQA